MKGYFASHFFNDAYFRWTEDLASLIEKETNLKLYVPQRNESINDKKGKDEEITDIAIAKADTAALKEANILIACIDGVAIDPGVAGEVMAHGIMKEMEEERKERNPRLILGVITDMRWKGTGENKLYRNQLILGKIRQHGYLIEGYAGKEEWKQEIIDKINDFIKENS